MELVSNNNGWTKMSRQEFLDWRARQTSDAVEFQKSNPDINVIVMDFEDEIVCDVCNCTVESETVHYNSWGLYCDDCRKEYT